MRITFLTPRLAPGVCGLADHTGLLAAALVPHGAEIGFVYCAPQPQTAGLPAGPVARWTDASRLWDAVERQQPDWLWVQLSSYGYSRWGAPYRLARELRGMQRLAPELRVAICVHETHCTARQLGLKGPLLAPLQRHAVASVVRTGDVVFAATRTHCRQVMRQYGVRPERVHRLAIGSNVPPARLDPAERAALRRRLGWGADATVAVIFGSTSSQLHALDRFAALLHRGLRQGRLHRLLCIGGEAGGAGRILQAARQRLVTADVLDVRGFLPAADIGRLLECCDFGLVPTPYPLLEKSGVFAAFAAAGLAVLVHGGNGGACGELPVLCAESWDWEAARSERVLELRRALLARARTRYAWDAIARAAIACLRSSGRAGATATLGPTRIAPTNAAA